MNRSAPAFDEPLAERSCVCRQSRCILCNSFLSTAGLESQQICRIEGLIAKGVFRRGQQLFRQGAPAQSLFVLRHGFVRLISLLPDGRTQGIGLGGAWTLLGAEALYNGHHSYTAEAATDAQVCSIRVQDMQAVLAQDADTVRRLVVLLVRELDRAMALIQNLGAIDAMARVATFLLSFETAAEGAFELPLSRVGIAEMLGLSVETVSRAITRLRQQGIIDAPPNRRFIQIIDRDRLVELAQRSFQAATARARSASFAPIV